MKTVKRLLCLLSSTVLMFCLQLPIQAHDKTEHNQQMRDALFKVCFSDMNVYRHFEKDEAENAIHALECAAYLAIDQFNGGGKDELEYLKTFGVKNLPNSIDEIDFKSNQYHRKYTHRGWDAEIGVYNTTDGNRWKTRKQIIINTADKIFGSKLNSTKKKSFCAIIYYIHLLGDRESGDKYYNNSIVMELGGRTDKQDIISELIKHIGIFTDSAKNGRTTLENKLMKYGREVKSLTNNFTLKIEGELFSQYKEIAHKILTDLLPKYLPEILKAEKPFSDIFYAKQ